MSKKNVREMSKRERARHSLSAKVFRSVLLGSVLLGVVMLVIGLTLYSIAVANTSISTAFNLSKSAAAILPEVTDTYDLSHTVMERYNALSDEERADPESEEYEALFIDLIEREDYKMIFNVLNDLRESSDVFDVYLGTFDQENNTLVYFVDTDEESFTVPGYWEHTHKEGIDQFVNWNGEGLLYDIENTELYGWLCTAGVPIRTDSGELTGFIMADISLDSFIKSLNSFVLQYVIALLILVAVFCLLMVRHMRKKVIIPIDEIARTAQEYVADKKAGVQTVDHFASLNIHTGDEIENLSLIMADMEHDITDFEDNLTKVTAEKQRISTELDLATRIQADMLPNIFPAFPERNEFNIYASMTPAKEVGGDFYDFFFVDHDRLALVIADVSGKGIPAAMFMMMAKSMIQTQAVAGRNPKEILETVNRLICDNNREQMFVTVWFAILDLNTGLLTAANAGHEYPIFKEPDGEFEIYKDKHGFVLGGMKGVKYKEYELLMKPGAKLFVYTDGVAEAMNADNELFGVDRAMIALNAAKDEAPEELLKSVDEAISRFVGDAEQFDDLTMLCVEYNGTTAEKQ